MIGNSVEYGKKSEKMFELLELRLNLKFSSYKELYKEKSDKESEQIINQEIIHKKLRDWNFRDKLKKFWDKKELME